MSADINDFINAKNEVDKADNRLVIYERQKPLMDAVLDVAPSLGAYLDSKIEIKLKNYQSEKRKIFVEIVLENKDIITRDMVSEEEFLVNFMKTVEVVERLSTNDKVVYYANLIRNGYLSGEPCIDSDMFDECMAIINDLSYREMVFLAEFAKHAKENPVRIDESGDYLVSGEDWIKYYHHMKETYPNANPRTFLKRLSRTGFVEEYSGWFGFENNSLVLDDRLNKHDLEASFILLKDYFLFEKMVIKRVG